MALAQKLGVAPSMTIGHVAHWGEVFHDHILGPERADRIDPTGSLKYISTGASRLWQRPPRQVLGSQQRIAVDRAIKAVTLDAAYAMFMDDKVGSLEPGKWADLVILDQNPRTTEPAKIPQIKVLETGVSGKRAHPAK